MKLWQNANNDSEIVCFSLSSQIFYSENISNQKNMDRNTLYLEVLQ